MIDGRTKYGTQMENAAVIQKRFEYSGRKVIITSQNNPNGVKYGKLYWVDVAGRNPFGTGFDSLDQAEKKAKEYIDANTTRLF
jgi:hypothetical protein